MQSKFVEVSGGFKNIIRGGGKILSSIIYLIVGTIKLKLQNDFKGYSELFLIH